MYTETKTIICNDIKSDPYLRYILLLCLFVSGFWFWWRAPNFSNVDEFHRIGQSMKIGRFLLVDPSFDTIKQAAEVGIGKDASIYLHGLVLLPLFIAVVLMGELPTLIEASSTSSPIGLWNAVPAWFWTTALVLTRLLNVLLVVSAVYMVYRIGTVLADRRAGRIAGLFTSLSLGVIHTAHEVNEDTPALLLLLVVLYLSIRYAQTGNSRYFLIGCGLGGLAIAFKLTAGVAVVFLCIAYLLRAVEKSDPIGALWQPRLLLSGMILGAVIIYVGIPNLLLRGPEWFIEVRVSGQTAQKAAESTVPHGYSALMAYLNGLGLPLLIATIVGLLLSIKRVARTDYNSKDETILLAGLAAYLLVFVGLWTDFRTHHILPSIPLLILPFGITLSRYFDTRTEIAKVVFSVVLITTAMYAGAGLLKFTDDPRDEAANWIETEGDTEDTIAVFERSPATLGLVHGQPTDHYQFGETTDPGDPYTEWLISTPDREPDYIQITAPIPGRDEYPRRDAFATRLIDGDHYGYVVAAEFGDRSEPRNRQQPILYAGIEPTIEKRFNYAIIYAKNESIK